MICSSLTFPVSAKYFEDNVKLRYFHGMNSAYFIGLCPNVVVIIGDVFLSVVLLGE